MVDALVGADFADVDQAFDAFRDLHERAELGGRVTGPSTTSRRGNCLRDVNPGIAQRLLESERDAALAGTDAEDDSVDASPGFTTSLGCRTFFAQDISETWIRPSIPGSSSTNAPKSANARDGAA